MNILNKNTQEFGLTEAQVKSWFLEREVTVLWSSPFVPIEPFILYREVDYPEYNRDTQKVQQVAPVIIDEELTQQWQVVDLNAEELVERLYEKEREEFEAREAARIVITRTQGLKALFRLRNIKQSDIQTIIDDIEDEDDKYEAGPSFEASNWYSDDEFVLRMAPHIGAESEEELRALFEYAKTI